jgi:DNA-binding response OmpR family regulator
MTRLLIVANDIATARQVGPALEAGGRFRATQAESVAEAITRGSLETSQYAAVVVVTARPMDNPDLLISRLRQIWTHCPIVIFAEQADEEDIVRALDAGASDFILAPFRPGELQARLRAQIRAHANSATVVFQIGPYRCQPVNRILQHITTGATVRLTHKEMEVLRYLHRNEGQPVARQTLLREVWGYKDGADSYTVESHIYRLRRKIEADPSRPRFLLNEERGYLLVTAPPRPWPPVRSLALQLAG